MRLIVFFILSFLISCANDPVQYKVAVLHEEKDLVVLRPDSNLSLYNHCFITKDQDGNCCLALYDKKRCAEIFFDLSGNEIARVSLTKPAYIGKALSEWFIFPLCTDSILAFASSESNTVWLYGKNGEIVNQFHFDNHPIDTISEYGLVGIQQSAPLFINQTLYIPAARIDISPATINSRKSYFSTPPLLAVDQKRHQFASGYWPVLYKEGLGWNDYYPQTCSNYKGQIVMSFECSDSIFVMEKNKIVAQYHCPSQYMTEIRPFPDDSLISFTANQKYSVIEPRYMSLSYNPWAHVYFRVVHHAIEYETNNGMKHNRFIDKPWSLMVLNENFEIMSETKMDAARFYARVFPCPNGFLVEQRNDKTGNQLPVFSFFKIEE
jgi:Domain of unknown function (DUF4221)